MIQLERVLHEVRVSLSPVKAAMVDSEHVEKVYAKHVPQVQRTTRPHQTLRHSIASFWTTTKRHGGVHGAPSDRNFSPPGTLSLNDAGTTSPNPAPLKIQPTRDTMGEDHQGDLLPSRSDLDRVEAAVATEERRKKGESRRRGKEGGRECRQEHRTSTNFPQYPPFHHLILPPPKNNPAKYTARRSTPPRTLPFSFPPPKKEKKRKVQPGFVHGMKPLVEVKGRFTKRFKSA